MPKQQQHGSPMDGVVPPSQQYCLRWKYHHSNLQAMFSQLLERECFCDVTLACDGKTLKAHKVMLSACSTYFDSIFSQHEESNPIVILKDVRYCDLKALVQFMYKGEINVENSELTSLLKTAEELRIKGLAEVSWRSDHEIDADAADSPADDDDECSAPKRHKSEFHQQHKLIDGVADTRLLINENNNKPQQQLDGVGSASNVTMKEEGGTDEDGGGDDDVTSEMDDDSPTSSYWHGTESSNASIAAAAAVIYEDSAMKIDETGQPPIGNLSGGSYAAAGAIQQQSMGGGVASPPTVGANSATPDDTTTAYASETINSMPDLSQYPDIMKMNDYLESGGRRPQFWEEPFTKRLMEAIKNKELEMKVAAELMGVSYGTLYGRYRDAYGCLKHPYRVRDFWSEQGPAEVLAKLQRKELTLFRAAEMLNVTVTTLANYLSTLKQGGGASGGAGSNLSDNEEELSSENEGEGIDEQEDEEDAAVAMELNDELHHPSMTTAVHALMKKPNISNVNGNGS